MSLNGNYEIIVPEMRSSWRNLYEVPFEMTCVGAMRCRGKQTDDQR